MQNSFAEMIEPAGDGSPPQFVTVDSFLRDKANLNKLVAHAYIFTHDHEAAVELVHEAVVKALKLLSTESKHTGQMVNYFKTTISNTFISQQRKRQSAERAGDFGNSLEAWIDEEESGEKFDVEDDGDELDIGVWLAEARAIGAEADKVIDAAIDQLTPGQSLVVRLSLGVHPAVPGLIFSQSEIAALFNKPVARVKWRWRQGQAKLRTLLQSYWDDWKGSR